MEKKVDTIFLFDIDGTLTPSREKATEPILKMLKELRKRVNVGFVGGSDLPKQVEQIGDNLLELFDFGFPQNGAQHYEGTKLITSSSVLEYLGEENYKKLINKVLRLLSETDCPVKRSNFVELRESLINVAPVGRNCLKADRVQFLEYDKVNKVRQKICDALKSDLDAMGMQASIGGQISIDIFPKGWDKTFCLRHLHHKNIYFFGDMTMEGGNDHEIFTHERVIGTTVYGPESTILEVNKRLKELNIPEISYD